jgi:hypothetical protein
MKSITYPFSDSSACLATDSWHTQQGLFAFAGRGVHRSISQKGHHHTHDEVILFQEAIISKMAGCGQFAEKYN